jgi:GT2 family glycosyltransferase
MNETLSIQGKFLYLDGEKFFIKGVTYGWFPPEDNEGVPYPRPDVVRKDFELMKSAGINTIRTFDPPPDYVLEIASELDIKVIVGIWVWHKYIFDDKKFLEHYKNVVNETISKSSGYDSVIMYTIGNEIPIEIIRYYGNKRIERFLLELYKTAKKTNPNCVVTYVNYPTTEFLDLSFLDLTCFNVYIYYEDGFRAYMAKLHNIAGEKPLLLGEIGVDSLRNSESKQAELLEWKIKASFEEGLCGVNIFKWSDLWWRGGNIIHDWKFGIVDEERKPKKAYEKISHVFQSDLNALLAEPPLISVVVAVYNGEPYIRECIESLIELNYPHKEIIVVDDGSTDSTPSIVEEYPVKLVKNNGNLGLSVARNNGIEAANGEIVAFTDSDCRVDPDWLFYIASEFSNADTVGGVGGPNLTPSEDDFMARVLGEAIGGPKCVLITDKEAEHIPGCNMAFRRKALKEIGGFDPIYTRAGDDVDVCWRLREAGYQIIRAPSAVVWHHRRGSVKKYFKQQAGYGVAEALLGRKHPDKYSHRGLKWVGKVYGAIPVLSFSRPRIYYASFPYVYSPVYGSLSYLPMTFDWYLMVLLFLALTPISGWFTFLSLALLGITVLSALLVSTRSTKFDDSPWMRLKKIIILTVVNFLWPIARGYGRIVGSMRLK